MGALNPEFKEERESIFEAKKFSREYEKKLLDVLDSGNERFPDIIQCPVDSCRNPLTVHVHSDMIHVVCTNCGWEQVIKH